MNILTEKKITKATFKKFIKDNKQDLFVLVRTKFDGMIDGITNIKDIPHKAEFGEPYEEHTLGIKGVWLVGSSRDYFYHYEDQLFVGITTSNSCGSFTVAILKKSK